MYNVVVIGVGQLGSRYLQGLAAVSLPLNIVAVDPGRSARSSALARWEAVIPKESQHKIKWAESLASLEFDIDLAIVATSADHRADVVEALCASCIVRYWILEKVVSQSTHEFHRIMSAVNDSHGSWVNLPRRLMNWHQRIASFLAERGPLDITLEGGMWGLACNAVHFLDLVSWWTGEALTSVDTSHLETDWFDSKRIGFFEVCGSMTAHYSAGSRITLVSSPADKDTHISIDYAGDTAPLTISENEGSARASSGHLIQGGIEMQSSLTRSLVESILIEGKCGLTPLTESLTYHSVFLDSMLAHWNRSVRRTDTRVPIT